MMRSLPVWSLSLCAFSQNFMNVGTVVYLPSYYNSVLRMDLTSVSRLANMYPERSLIAEWCYVGTTLRCAACYKNTLRLDGRYSQSTPADVAYERNEDVQPHR